MHRMKRIKLHDRSFRLMIEADVIDREIERVGTQINRELAGERMILLWSRTLSCMAKVEEISS